MAENKDSPSLEMHRIGRPLHESAYDIDKFKLTCVGIPFHFGQFLRILLLHLFPFLFPLMGKDAMEPHVCHFTFASFSEGSFGFIYFAWKDTIAIIFATVLYIVLFMLRKDYPAGQTEGGSVSTGFFDATDIISDIIIIPGVCVFMHRLAVAVKYGSISPYEYAKYFSLEKKWLGTQKHFYQTMALNVIHGYSMTRKLRTDSESDESQLFLIGASLCRLGTTAQAMIVRIPFPDSQDPLNVLNFKRWQALLLGRVNLLGLSSELEPELKNIMRIEKNSKTGKANYTVSTVEVVNALLNWRWRAAYCKDGWTIRIATVFNYLLFPIIAYPYFLVQRSFWDNKGIVAMTLMCSLLTTSVLYTYYPLLVIFMAQLEQEFSRERVGAIMLSELIRNNDLDVDNNLTKLGITKYQRTAVPDVIDEIGGEEGKEYISTSSRNPDIARLPTINTDCNSRGNVLAWVQIRCIMQDFGYRFKARLNMYSSTTIALVMLLLLIAVYRLVSTITCDETCERDRSHADALANPLFVLTSPYSLLLLNISVVAMVCFLLAIIEAIRVNDEYSSHLIRLTSSLENSQRELRLLMSRAQLFDDAEVLRLTELCDMKRRAILFCKNNDKSRYTTCLGAKADGNFLSVFFTAGVVAPATILFTLYAILISRGLY